MRRRYLAAACLLSLFGGFAGQYLFAASDDANNCPVTPLVTGHPGGTPTTSNNHWYANADRSIWVTFLGQSSLRSALGEPVDPVAGKAPGHKEV